MHHILRPNPCVELLRGQEAQSERGLAQRQVLAVRLQGDLRGLLVADVRVERGHQHERVIEVLPDPPHARLDARRAAVVERACALGQQPDRLQHVVKDDRLIDVELEIALRSRESDGVIVAEDLHGNHGQCFALGGIDLPWHDRRPRLVCRNQQLGQSGAGAGRVPADVVGDLHQGAGKGAQRRADVDHRVVSRQRRELVRRRDERFPGLVCDSARRDFAETGVGVQAGADGGATDGERADARQRAAEARERLVELADPGRDRLPERQRCRVLQVGPANHHDSRECLGLGVQRVSQRADGGDEHVVELLDGGDVHRGGERVVGRLAVVHIVVGVNRLFRSHDPAREVDRAVRDHLVGVHVGLGSRAGLEHDERELVVELPIHNVLRGPYDEVDLIGRQLA